MMLPKPPKQTENNNTILTQMNLNVIRNTLSFRTNPEYLQQKNIDNRNFEHEDSPRGLMQYKY